MVAKIQRNGGTSKPLDDLHANDFLSLSLGGAGGQLLGSGAAGGGIAHPDLAPASPDMAAEVAFIAGVNADGTLPLEAFSAWNNDTPATYTGGFTNTAKWGADTAHTAGGNVLYYFDPASHWSATEQTFLSAGLALWSDVANITFTATTDSTKAQITFTRGTDGSAATNTTDNVPAGAGQTGGKILLQLTSADISIDTSGNGFGPIDGSFTTQGGYPIMTFLHEEGHAIGLGHAGPYNGDVNAATQQFSAYDTRLWSIMSYIEPQTASAQFFSQYPVSGTQWHNNDPTGLMPLDILAAQALYGAPTTTPLSGGQVFGFNCNIVGPTEMFFDFTKNTTPITTLFDTGTNNTLDISGYAQASKVDLVAGTYSSFDGMANNMAIAFGTAIDKFVGGTGSDTVTANNDGDTLNGGLGDDILIGGKGNDLLIGNAGNDTAVFTGAHTQYSFAAVSGGDTVTDLRAGAPDGTDTLQGVESVQFSDGTFLLSSLVTSDSAPVLAGTAAAATYIEQGTPVVVDGAITVTDSDSSTLAGATVTISGGRVAGDTLNFTAQSGITGVYANGVLTLSGAASAAAYQAALRSVTFSSTSDDPTAAGRTIGFAVNDGTLSSNTLAQAVGVTPVNDPPSLAGTSAAATFAAHGAAVVIDSAIHAADADTANLAGATVTITAGAVAGDVLGFAAQNGITGAYNATTHVLTLSGSATLAQYGAALESVTFSSTSADPTNAGANPARTISFQADDGQAANHASNVLAATVNVSAVAAANAAPVLGGGGNVAAYTEQGTPAAVDPSITVSDADSANLAGATATFVSGFLGGDQLNFTNQNGITGSWNATTHVLSLSGSASVAAYQAALRSVTFSSTSDDPTHNGGDPNRTIYWAVDDGQSANHASNVVATTIGITAVNDAPVLGSAGNTISYTEQATAVAIDAAITVTDPDSTTMSGATASFVSGFLGGDALSFTNQSGITGSWNATTHVLTLSGTATVAAYQAAMRSVKFSSTSDDPTHNGGDPNRTIYWQVDDGQSVNHASKIAVTTIAVTGVNDAPVLTGAGNTASYTEQAAGVSVAPTITVTDVDTTTMSGATASFVSGFLGGDALSFANQNGITGSWNATTHVLTLSGTATIAAYQAAMRSVKFSSTSDDPTHNGGDPSRTIYWTVDDGQSANHASKIAISTIAITPVNDAPVLGGAGNTASYTEHGAAVSVTPAITIADPDTTTMSSATANFVSGFLGGDQLNFTNQNGITGSWNATTHVLTLSGTATIAAYQAAMRSVTFSSTSDDPTHGGGDPHRTIDWQVDDGQSANHASNVAISTIAISVPSGEAPRETFAAAKQAPVNDAIAGTDHFVFQEAGGAVAHLTAAHDGIGDTVALYGNDVPDLAHPGFLFEHDMIGHAEDFLAS